MPTPTNPRTITITGMTGETCVQTVRAALKNVSGVTTESVTVGKAIISCGYPAAYGAACAAITSAGFRTTETAGAPAPSPFVPHSGDVEGELDPVTIQPLADAPEAGAAPAPAPVAA